jgi:hypothetical protein
VVRIITYAGRGRGGFFKRAVNLNTLKILKFEQGPTGIASRLGALVAFSDKGSIREVLSGRFQKSV